jgi:hypothetical protein
MRRPPAATLPVRFVGTSGEVAYQLISVTIKRGGRLQQFKYRDHRISRGSARSRSASLGNYPVGCISARPFPCKPLIMKLPVPLRQNGGASDRTHHRRRAGSITQTEWGLKRSAANQGRCCSPQPNQTHGSKSPGTGSAQARRENEFSIAQWRVTAERLTRLVSVYWHLWRFLPGFGPF